MKVEEVMQFRRAVPFKPFVLRLTDGRQIFVRDPMHIGRNNAGNRITIALPDESFETVEEAAVAGVEIENGSGIRDRNRGAGS